MAEFCQLLRGQGGAERGFVETTKGAERDSLEDR